MTAAELIMTNAEIEADRDKWLAYRRDGIGASEAAMLLDLAPDRIGGRFVLYHRKLEGLDTIDTSAMERGRWLEPYVAEQYAKARPHLEVHQGGLYRNTGRPWMIATPDRIAGDKPVQLKTSIPMDEFDEDTGRLPAYHRAQGLWEMATTGAAEVEVPVLFIVQWEVVIFTIKRDAKAKRDIGLLIEAGEEMRWRLEHRKEPDPDATVACTDTLKRLYPLEERSCRVPIELARRYRATGKAARRVKARRQLAVNQMLHYGQGATSFYAVDHEDGLPRDGYQVRVASVTEAERKAYEVPASDGPVRQVNPLRWARND
jgi:putative phage-type endonuclease